MIIRRKRGYLLSRQNATSRLINLSGGINMAAPYFLYVDGKGCPKHPHGSLESAETEARRLFEKYAGERSVSILETNRILEAKPMAQA